MILDLSHEITAGLLEHMTNLELVPEQGATLTALPAPVRGMASFPVRAVAVC
ncbi:MAG TPA: hypothetical protein VFW16_10695 [Streptosporangiaceae bacterium]|nr:hypothetical protein [Streptosporangiaceae bacterium]